ncbi:MAG TPA: alpha/beta hydrolase [Thermoanaerobaculia bacterium]|nr:alpha/beta hydrolase [Thermoanaerobaculia bacterium]
MTRTLTRLLAGTAGVAAGATSLTYVAYRKDIRDARRRVESGRQFLDSPHGPIEFAEAGDGPAVLFIHGAGGGFDQGLDVGRVFLGDGYRLIAPSRFGYLGTPVPKDASAEAQADAHRRLLDALHLDRVPVIAISAGAPSAMRLCLDHPDRCSALVLIVPGAYAPEHVTLPAASSFFQTVLNTIASSDLAFWTATKVTRSTLVKTILGTPIEVYRNATAEQRRSIDATLLSVLPVSRRVAGISNDNVVVSGLSRYPLEEMRVPALVISAADDLYGTYENGLYTAAHIRDARFLGFRSGGHLLVGHDAEVRSQITAFLKASMVAEALATTASSSAI